MGLDLDAKHLEHDANCYIVDLVWCPAILMPVQISIFHFSYKSSIFHINLPFFIYCGQTATQSSNFHILRSSYICFLEYCLIFTIRTLMAIYFLPAKSIPNIIESLQTWARRSPGNHNSHAVNKPFAFEILS